tara:strand:+ start:1100 stop:1693 length:594 start_codon:yes stop_codon:yes gene_type:complete
MWLVSALALSYARPLETGAWEISQDYKYFLDEGLAAEVAALVRERGFSTLMDLGAGTGRYAAEWKKRGLSVTAYDGATNIESLSAGLVRQHDLTTPLPKCPASSVVTSLEVAEHIPADKQDVYLYNLFCAKPRLVVISWAPAHQRGNGHVNGRTALYVRKLMRVRGYAHDPDATARLRAHARLPWFKSNVQAFVAND